MYKDWFSIYIKIQVISTSTWRTEWKSQILLYKTRSKTIITQKIYIWHRIVMKIPLFRRSLYSLALYTYRALVAKTKVTRSKVQHAICSKDRNFLSTRYVYFVLCNLTNSILIRLWVATISTRRSYRRFRTAVDVARLWNSVRFDSRLCQRKRRRKTIATWRFSPRIRKTCTSTRYSCYFQILPNNKSF